MSRLAVFALLLAGSGVELAIAQSHQHVAPPPGEVESRERDYFTDVELVDQDGRTHRFYSDLLRGNVVIAHSFFTECTGVCPVMAGKVVALQRQLGERLGRDAIILSLSVDPETDTPERLKSYAERFGALPGWYFLGGAKENVDQALHRLGQYVEQRESHTNVIIMGNEPEKRWKKVFGLGPATELALALEDLMGPGSGAP